MIQRRNYLGLYEPAGRPTTAPYREDMHRDPRTDWAAFCTSQCPHKGRSCDRGPCKEFVKRFGRRRGV